VDWQAAQALAKVELGVILGAHAVNLQKSAVGVGVVLAALVPQDDALGIQAHWLLGLLHCLLDLLLTCHVYCDPTGSVQDFPLCLP